MGTCVASPNTWFSCSLPLYGGGGGEAKQTSNKRGTRKATCGGADPLYMIVPVYTRLANNTSTIYIYITGDHSK